MSTRLNSLLLLVMLSLLLQGSINGQERKGMINGSVSDTGHDVLPGARVELQPKGRAVVSDAQGQFTVPDLAPGDYTLTISYVGFAPFSKPVTVAAGEAQHIDAVLQVENVSDQMLITAERPQAEAEAVNITRTSDDIVQVLPANVINSLPNTNIADAVGRLPSVTLERDEGEGKYVQIRGTEPRLSNVTINGVLVPSPEGQVRNIKLDAVPSDILDRIEVFKTLSPDHDGNAIGGTVNLVTKAAGERPIISFNAQGGYTPIQDGRWLDVFDGTVGERFGSNKQFGVLFGGTFDHNDRGIDDLEPTQAIGNVKGRNFAFINSEDLRTYKYYRNRYGFDENVDYNIKPGLNVYIRGLYSDFHDYGDTWVYTPNAGSIVSNNGAQTTFDNTGFMQYRQYVRRPDQGVFRVAAGLNYAFSTTVVNIQFAVSQGHNDGGQDFATTYFNGPAGVQFGLDESNPLRPKLSPIDGTNIYDPNTYSVNFTTVPSYHSKELDLQGDANLAHSYTLGSHASEFQMGLGVRNAHKTQNENDQFLSPVQPLTMDQFLGTQSNPNYYDRSFTFGPLTDYRLIQNAIASSGFAATPDQLATDHIVGDPANWDTSERVYAGYLMDSISFGKLRLVGGLRIEGTTDAFNANQVNLNNGAYVSTVPISGNGSYVNFMPSIQAQYLIEKNTTLRLSYGRGISRPNFQDIVPSVQVDPNASPKSIQVGNPALKPTRANNYDVEVEHFFQPLGIIQAGFFYKGLTDPIYPTASFVPNSDPNFPGFLRQESINGPRAYIVGFETSWQQRMSRLPGLLSGLGVAANYSRTGSRVTFPAGFSSASPGGQGRIDHPTLQRQAPNTWNLGLTYDKGRFSMRFAVSHNDANLFAYQYVHDPTVPNVDKDPIIGIKGPLGDQYLYAHTQFDIQGTYRLYKGLEFVASGLNLSNEVFGFYTGSPIYPNQREYYHPTVSLGFRWMSGAER